jgi:hypothetical protein
MSENVQRTTGSASKDEEALRGREKLALFVAKQTQPEGAAVVSEGSDQVRTTKSTVGAKWQTGTVRLLNRQTLSASSRLRKSMDRVGTRTV